MRTGRFTGPYGYWRPPLETLETGEWRPRCQCHRNGTRCDLPALSLCYRNGIRCRRYVGLCTWCSPSCRCPCVHCSTWSDTGSDHNPSNPNSITQPQPLGVTNPTTVQPPQPLGVTNSSVSDSQQPASVTHTSTSAPGDRDSSTQAGCYSDGEPQQRGSTTSHYFVLH